MVTTFKQRAWIGLGGALCLSLLKLATANFYLDAGGTVAAGAYLTFLAYLVLGFLVAGNLTEEHPEPTKTKRSAFLMGLLAPSILISVVSSSRPPVSDVPSSPIRDVPRIGWLVSSAIAQQPTESSNTTPELAVRLLSRNDVTGGVGAGVFSALGVSPVPKEKWLYIVGATANQAAATKTALSLNDYLRKAAGNTDWKAEIIRPMDGKQFYVTVGSLLQSSDAISLEKEIKETAVRTLVVNDRSAGDRVAAEMLLRGDLYKGRDIFNKRP